MTLSSFLKELVIFSDGHPDKPAIVDKSGSRTTTYSEMIGLMGSFQQKLVDSGVKFGDSVAIILGRDMEHYVSRLAALTIGAVPLSINPDLPRERIDFMLDDSNAKCIIDDGFVKSVKGCHEPVIVDIDDSERGFIIYTSGTTGKPKGVLHPRASFEAQRQFVIESDPIREDDNFGAVRDMMAITSLWCDMFTPLCRFATVHIIDDERKDIVLLSKYYREHDINVSSMNPNVVKMLDAPDCFKVAMITGETAFDIGERDFFVINHLSTTECVVLSFQNVSGRGLAPVGNPVTCGQLILISDDGGLSDRGEICYVGPGIMDCYLNLPELTERTITPSPVDGRRMYHSGDIGVRNPDGMLTVIGRMDSMTKVNGFRVEPAEVEINIRDIAGIEQAVVKVFHEGYRNILCAYFISKSLNEEEVRSQLRDKLPEYMIPSFFVRVDSFAKNRNGKIDRSVLTLPVKMEGYVAPVTESERLVCDAFSKVFGTLVGLEGDFISLGGDSLMAMTVQHELCGRVSSSQLLMLRRPSAIARVLTRLDACKSLEWDGSPIPLTESQLNVYLDEVSGTKRTAYNIPFTVTYPPTVTMEGLLDALRKVIDAHPVLRGRVIDEDIPKMAFDAVPSIEVGQAPLEILPFDLKRGPLCRFVVSYGCLAEHESLVLHADMHHLIFDGGSFVPLLADIGRAFAGEPLTKDLSFSAEPIDRSTPEMREFFERKFCDMNIDSGIVADIDGMSGVERSELAETKECVSGFCKSMSITVGSFFASAFAYTLSRFTGRSNAVFLTVENGRDSVQSLNAIGMYVRTVPVCIECNDSSVGEFLSEASASFLGSVSSSSVPFRELVSHYGSFGRVSFQFEDGLFVVPDIGVQPSDMKRLNHDPTFDFDFAVSVVDGGYSVRLEHSNIVSISTAKRFVSSFGSIVSGLMTSRRMKDIRFTSLEDIAIQDRINDTGHELRYNDIIEAFKEKVSQQPDHVLVTYMNRRYTYGEADHITDGIAYAIAKKGIGKGDNVAILVPRSEWYLLAALAVLKTGAAYVPIDDSYPDERIALMISDSSAKCIIVSDGTIDRTQVVGDIPYIDVDQIDYHGFEVKDVPDTAVILYTSGSTGEPKGAIISHVSIINMAESYIRHSGFTKDDSYGMYVSISFDMHTTAFYPAILAGGSIDIIPDNIRLDMVALNEHLVEYNVTHSFMTTQIARNFTSQNPTTSLKYLLTGGEFIGSFDKGREYVINGYGPTEYLAVTSSIPQKDAISPDSVGKQYDNTFIYILDKEGRRVPFGAVGELYLSGYQLFDGYLNRTDLTSSVIGDNPFVTSEEAKNGYGRIYATGDYVRFLPDGTLGIIGRRDGQVKIRGNRVELTEVEVVIRSMDGIKDVTVQAVVNGSGGKELCAYVVTKASMVAEQPTSGSVQSFVSERKPAYMVPSYVIFIDSIPLNVNGKVDRHALPWPDMSSSMHEYIAPRNPNEEALCNAMAETLGLDRIGIDDDFIALGGDSLKSIKVQNIAKVTSTADIMRYRTPRNICEHILSLDFRLDLYTLETGCPLSECQLNVYLDIISNRKSNAYIIPFCYNIPEKCSKGRAVDVISKAVKAHPILSSRIELRGGEPWIVCDRQDYYSDVPLAEKDVDIEKSFSKFYIADGMITGLISHIAFDGFSISILIDTFFELFSGIDVPTETGFLTASSFDTSIKESKIYVRAEEFYDRMFCDADCDTGLVDDIDGRPGTIIRRISYSEDVVPFIRQNGFSLDTFFVSAFAYTLSRFTGRSESIFNVVRHGRGLPGTDKYIGMFVRTLPVRIDCSDTDVLEFISNSFDVEYGSMMSSAYPFREIHRKYGLKSDVMFQFMDGVEANAMKSSDPMQWNINDSTWMDHDDKSHISDINATVKENDGVFEFQISHSSRYSNATVERIAEAYDMIVTGLLSKSKLSEIQFTSAEDIAIQDRINDTGQELRYNDIIEAFKEKVSQQPDHVLVTYMNRRYTYGEADHITDGIAYAIAKKGIGKGDNVAILVPRSEWYLLAALAVLKTGAAYVPIDDSYPDERIAFMITDSSAKAILITSEIEGRANIVSNGIEKIPIESVRYHVFHSPTLSPDDCAVVLYTSGTTGIPKGSMITHRAITNHAEWYADFSHMTDADVYGLFVSCAFDMHTTGYYPIIVAGASLDIVPEDIRLDMNRLNDHFVSKNVTHTFITTQVGKLFASMDMPSKIRVLMYGGEKLGEFTAPDHLGALETYGPSENLALSTAIYVNDRCCSSSVGPVVNNIKAYIVDREGRRVPNGAVGELCLSGFQLSKGYLNRDDLNASAFRDNLFASPEEANNGYARLYATGDYFRYLPDGTLGVIGRRDGQVKIRGNRVELTEVESVIRSMGGIKDVTIQVIVNDAGGKELCAYIVIDASTVVEKPTSESVQSFVSGRKPPYMVPSFVVFLDSIPLNVNGKVDRRALPMPDVSSSMHKYVAPRNPNEEIICKAMADILGVEKIGIDDDFIAMGGDSLKAIRLASLCRSNGLTIHVNGIVSKRTVRAFSLFTKEAEDLGTYSGPVGLSPVQRMFMSLGTEEQRDWFNQSILLKSNNRLDVVALQKAVDAVTDHHDMLRAVFGKEHAVRGPGTSVCIVTEKAFVSKESMSKHMDSLQRSLSLGNGRLMAISIFTLGKGRDSEDYLFVTIHHMVIDGASWSIIIDDITSAYEAIKSRRVVTLPPRTTPFAAWVIEAATSIPESDRRYWASISKMVPSYLIASDKGISEPFSLRSDVRLSSIIGNAYGTDAVDVLLTALAESYTEVTGRRTLALRMEGHGRHLADVGRTVGWFTDMYPLILETKGDTIEDLFAIRKILHSVPNGGISFGLVNDEAGMKLVHNLPGFTFNYLGSAFVYDNGMFRSVNDISVGRTSSGIDLGDTVSFNILDTEDGFILCGSNVDSLSGLPEAFMSRIERIIDEVSHPMVFSCPLSESQLGVYLDEMANPRGTVYSAPGIVTLPAGISEERVRSAISELIEAHPILKGRIIEKEGEPWIVTDAEPEITIGEAEGFIRPFVLSQCLSRFRMLPNMSAVIWDMHHTIMDATSRSILITELRDILSGRSLVRETGFISTYTRSDLDLGAMSMAESFFERMFCDRDCDSGLIPDVDGKGYGSLSKVLSPEKKSIDAFVRDNGITVGSLFASVFAYTLSRFAGRSDAVFTFTDSGRTSLDSLNAVGMFVRTMAIAIDCSDTTVNEFLKNSSDTYIETMTYADYPFRKLANRHGLSMKVSYEYNADINADVLATSDGTSDLLTKVLLSETGVVSDLSFTVNLIDGRYSISVSHSGMYSDATAERFAYAFDSILSGMLTKTKLSEIEFTSLGDIAIQGEINRTEHGLRYNDIIGAFKEKVASQPNNALVTYLDRSYTYGEADRITGRIAYTLAKKGIGKGHNVAILVPRSEWYLLATIAVLKTGAAYVPIDDSYPDDRIATMLSDSSVKAILVTIDTIDRVSSLNQYSADAHGSSYKVDIVDVLDVDDTSECHPLFEPIDIDGDDGCVILYTSGTTGVAKGVPLSHHNVMNYCEWFVRETKMDTNDRFLMYCSFGFDVHVEMFYSSIVSGGSVYIVPDNIRLELPKLKDYIIERKITMVDLPTAVGRMFIQLYPDLPIKSMWVGGEELGRFDVNTNYTLYDTYGPTESTVSVTYAKVFDKMDSSSIGVPVSNVKLHILDKEKRYIPVGAVGELHISGAQIASGYLNLPEKTSESFFRIPSKESHSGVLVYATGDYARYLPDGSIGYIGRRDGQVKIRGNRVELAEVEAIIRSLNGVRDVTVQAIINDNGGKELCAYVVADPRNGIDEVDTQMIRDCVSLRKPAYMVPSYVVFLDSIPLNINCKVDKRALPKPDVSALRREFVAPRNPNESKLCDAFAEVLGLDRIWIDDDFIQLGGDSLKAIKVTACFNAKSHYGLLSTSAIMKSRTPRMISQNLKKKVDFDENMYSYECGCPLTITQRTIFNFSVHNDMSVAIPEVITDDSWTSAEDVRDALLRLISAHPILCSRITRNNGEPWLSFFDDVEIPIVDAEPKSFSSTFYQRFDFEKDVLARFAVVRWEGRVYAFMHMAHLIYDAYSSASLYEDLSRLIKGEDIELDTGALRLAAYDRALHDDEEFRKTLDPMIAEIVSSDVSRSDGPIFSAGIVSRRVEFNGLDDCASKFNTSLGYLLSSIFAYAICRTMKERKCSFTFIDSGRGNFDFIDSIGLFMNLIDVSASGDIDDLDGFIRTSIDDIYRFVDAGITSDWSIDNKDRYITKYAFDYVNTTVQMAPVDIGYKPPEKLFNDLFALVYREGDTLTMTFNHSDTFDGKTTETILGHFIDGIYKVTRSNGSGATFTTSSR